jgi:hypothetical protein
MMISNEPDIPKEIRTLLTKGITGQQGKSKAMDMVIRFIRPVFLASASARESCFN